MPDDPYVVRVDAALRASAQAAGLQTGRSAAQQISYWARLGRAVEQAPAVSERAVQRVLGGEQPYDSLTDLEQVIVCAHWSEQLDSRAAGIDMSEILRLAGRTHAFEADAEGHVVRRELGLALSDPVGRV